MQIRTTGQRYVWYRVDGAKRLEECTQTDFYARLFPYLKYIMLLENVYLPGPVLFVPVLGDLT